MQLALCLTDMSRFICPRRVGFARYRMYAESEGSGLAAEHVAVAVSAVRL